MLLLPDPCVSTWWSPGQPLAKETSVPAMPKSSSADQPPSSSHMSAMKQIFAYSLLAASILVAVPSAHAQLMPSAQPAQGQGMSVGNGSLDRIVAVVEEDVILESELDEAINAIVRQYASNPGQLPPKDVLARQVLDRLILMKLQVQRANDQGIRVSDQDVDQAAANVANDGRTSASPNVWGRFVLGEYADPTLPGFSR